VKAREGKGRERGKRGRARGWREEAVQGDKSRGRGE